MTQAAKGINKKELGLAETPHNKDVSEHSKERRVFSSVRGRRIAWVVGVWREESERGYSKYRGRDCRTNQSSSDSEASVGKTKRKRLRGERDNRNQAGRLNLSKGEKEETVDIPKTLSSVKKKTTVKIISLGDEKRSGSW